MSPVCQICGIQGHPQAECGYYAQPESHISEVNYTQNNGPFSNSYNPNWRHHPNLSYRQGQGQFNQQQNYSQNYKPPMQFNSYRDNRQNQANDQNQAVPDENAREQQNMKDQMNRMSTKIGSLKDMMKTFLASQTVQNADNKLPAQPIANPKQCGAVTTIQAITTRSGKVLESSSGNQKARVYIAPARRNLENDVAERESHVEMNGNKETAAEREEMPSASEGNNIKVPFPSRLEKPKEDKQFSKFLEAMKDVQITIPILDAVMHVPLYAKFFKELITKKRTMDEPEVVQLTKECSALILNKMPQKMDDLGSFCVPCMIGNK